MANITTPIRAITAAAADTNSGYVRTDRFKKIGIEVLWTSDGTGDGTLTFYGSADGSNKYLLGVKPTLTGTLAVNAAVTMGTTSGKFYYDIVGVHPYIYLDWNNSADVQEITVNIIGQEEV